MRRNNKQLYESIMKDVSKTVKKRLNESTEQYEIEMDNICNSIDDILRSSHTNQDGYPDEYEIIENILRTITSEWTDNETMNTIISIIKNNK